MLTESEALELEQLIYDKDIEESREDLLKFTQTTFTKFTPSDFHYKFYDILNRFANKEIKNLIVSAPPQHGKLLPANTPVLTTKGWKEHGSLKSGDYVFGQDGKPKKVIGNSGVYEWNVDRIVFNDGNSMLAAKEHLWNLEVEYDDHKGRRTLLMETQEIFKRRHRRRPYIKCSPSIDLPERKLPIDPYILGCWLGDGHSRQGVLTVGSEDIDHFSKLGEAREVKTGIYRVLIKGLSKSLRLNNLILNKHIPEEYLLSSTEQRLELLRGLMDTDGCVDKRGNAEFTQMKGVLADQVHILLRSLGFKSRIKTYDAKLEGRKVGVKTRVLFNPNRTDIVFKLARKQARVSNKTVGDRNDKYKFFISGIPPHGYVQGNCIEVEGGMYLAGYDLIPTHNSEGSSRRLPAYIVGKRPDDKIALVSYAATKAQKFGREIMGIMREKQYKDIFPQVQYPERGYTGAKANTNENRESINSIGSMKFVGVSGPLTGDPVDVLILDDLYKDWEEGNSPVTQRKVWDWYISVADSRLNNDSQQLIVFTRWSEEDLIAKLEAKNLVVEWNGDESVDDLINKLRPDQFLKINYRALKEGEPNDYDPREPGEALWPWKHSKFKLESTRAKDADKFDCLYQGDPVNKEGLMYSAFKTYNQLPESKMRKNYTDTADTGQDYLCSINYDLPLSSIDPHLYVTDVLYTQKPMEYTEPATIKILNSNKVNKSRIESNNGGRGFARVVEKGVKSTVVEWFHQSKNKQARIYSQSATVNKTLVFPSDWHIRWPEFYKAVTKYKKLFQANKHDDAPDAMTGIVETEQNKVTVSKPTKPKGLNFGS